MTGINKAPIVLGLECEIVRVKVDAQPRPLGSGKCVAVIIQNALNDDDGNGNNFELMVGRGNGQPWQMIPGQESPVLYCNDLSDISVRTRALIGGLGAFNITVLIYKYPLNRR